MLKYYSDIELSGKEDTCLLNQAPTLDTTQYFRDKIKRFPYSMM